MTTYSQFKNNNVSEKITLAWLEPSQRLFNFTFNSEEGHYSKVTNFFVVGVSQDRVPLTEVFSLESLVSDTFYFDADTSTLYLADDPSSYWNEVTYRLFLSNTPIVLPYNMVTGGREVPYSQRLSKTSAFKSRFDAEQKGVALEGTGSVDFYNSDRWFAPIYDKLNWQNKAVTIYSTGKEVDPSEAVTLFSGYITNKSYDDNTVKFKIRDFIYKLRDSIELPLYTEEDGNLPDSLIGLPKRRVYGFVDGLLCDPVDVIGQSYTAKELVSDARGDSQTVNLTQDSTTAVFSDVSIHEELLPNDDITVGEETARVRSLSVVDFGLSKTQDVTFTRQTTTRIRMAFTGIDTSNVTTSDHLSIAALSNANVDLKNRIIGLFPIYAVDSAYIEFTLPATVSDTGFTDPVKVEVGEVVITKGSNTGNVFLQRESNVTLESTCLIKSATPYRRLNRKFFLTHHAISEAEKSVVSIISGVKVALDSITDLKVGDTIRWDTGTLSTIAGIDNSANIVTTTNTILPLPSFASTVKRLGIQRVTYLGAAFTPFRDYLPEVIDSGTTITFDNLAEFNVAKVQRYNSEVYFLSGSKQVLGSNNIFRNLNQRDWIKAENSGDWYEIAEKVSDNVVVLINPFAGDTGLDTALFKQPEYISDESKIIASLYGRTLGNAQAKHLDTAASVVRDILVEKGLESRLNETSFNSAKSTAPFMLSLALPLEKEGDSPSARDVINLINKSVFGSLFNDVSQKINYKVLNADRLESNAYKLNDFNVIGSPKVSTDSSNVLEKVFVQFAKKDADENTEAKSFSVEEATSEYVQNSEIDGQTRTEVICLYNRNEAKIIGQRILFINELAKSTLSFDTKLQLADAVLNDLVSITLDNLYERLGSSATSKLGLINSISKDGSTVSVEIDDLGNSFNRVAVISVNTSPDFSDDSDREYTSYITDSNGLIEGEQFNTNLIG